MKTSPPEHIIKDINADKGLKSAGGESLIPGTLKKYLAGFGIAGLIAGAGLVVGAGTSNAAGS